METARARFALRGAVAPPPGTSRPSAGGGWGPLLPASSVSPRVSSQGGEDAVACCWAAGGRRGLEDSHPALGAHRALTPGIALVRENGMKGPSSCVGLDASRYDLKQNPPKSHAAGQRAIPAGPAGGGTEPT